MFESENSFKTQAIGALYGICVPFILSVILVPAAALILYFTPDPAGLIFPIGLAVLYVSSFAGGFVAKLKGEKLISSVISGLLMTVLILLVSMLLGGNGTLSPVSAVIAYIAVLLAFIVGAVLHILISNKRPQRNRRRKRR